MNCKHSIVKRDVQRTLVLSLSGYGGAMLYSGQTIIYTFARILQQVQERRKKTQNVYFTHLVSC